MRRPTPFLLLLLLALAALPAASAARRPEPKPRAELRREIHVPFEDLGALLESGPRRVLLPRAEYERLRELATKMEDEKAPRGALLTSADYRITLERERARIQGTLHAHVLAEGLHALPLDVAWVGLQEVLLDGRNAAVGPGPKGSLHLFLEGIGSRQLTLRGVTPLETTAAQQILSFRLPTPPATRLRLVVPGDVEVRSGAAVIDRRFDDGSNATHLELVPERGSMTLVLSLNRRLKRQERTVVARSVLVDEVTRAYERLHATVSLEVLHRAVRDFRFALPESFEVTDVASPHLSRWEVLEEGGKRRLVAHLREETTDTVVLSLSAVRAETDLKAWTFPQFEPLDVVNHVAVVGVLLEQRLKARGITPRDLVAVDRNVLVQALPGTVRLADPGEAVIRTLAAYYAPGGGFGLSAEFFEPPVEMDVTSNILMSLRDKGLELSGGFAIRPKEERIFEIDFHYPGGWEVLNVTGGGSAALPFEPYPEPDGTRIHVRLARPILAGTEGRVFFTARSVPDGWFDAWATNRVAFPRLRIDRSVRHLGAVALLPLDDMQVHPELLSGLSPLDRNEQARYGLSEVDAGLAYRYEEAKYNARFRVTRIPARLTAETYSFFRVAPDVLTARYEVLFAVEEARTREVQLLLPANTPRALSMRGLNGTEVKEYSAENAGDFRRWTARLAAPRRDTVHVALDCELPLDTGDATNAVLPLVRADGVAYQSGFVSIEGNPELDVRIGEHPRKVDVGELIEAEYRPGRRLLGAFAFVGEPPPLRVGVARRSAYPLPPALVQRAELVTLLSAEGVSQSSLRVRLRHKVSFVEVALPGGSRLWSAMVDDAPAKPQQKGKAVLLHLPAASRPADVRVVYETPVKRLGFRSRASIPAPRLFLHESEGLGRREIPAADLVWHLYLPGGFEAVASKGSVICREIEPVSPAVTHVARWLYTLSGGITFRRGLIAGCGAPVLRTASRSAAWRKDEYAYYDDVGGVEGRDADLSVEIPEQIAVATDRPAPVEAPPPPPEPPKSPEQRVLEKMKNIVIPEIEFRQAGLPAIADFLGEASRDYDTVSANEEMKGVNFVLKRPPAARDQQVQAPADPFAAVTGTQTADAGFSTVTFTARRITLKEVLDIVAELANVKYRVKGNVVLIEPADAPQSDMVVRMYDVLPSVGERITATRADVGGRGGGDFMPLEPTRSSTERADWKEFFSDMGVPFPQGSSIKHLPTIGKLVVANTPDNLALLERVSDKFGLRDGEQPADPFAAEEVTVVKSPIVMRGIYGAKAGGKEAGLWALEGQRSLKIKLEQVGRALTFRSLGEGPRIEITLADERRQKALVLAAALLTFVMGAALTRRPAGRKAAYVIGVLLVSTIFPATPLFFGLARVMNGAFYAACLLVPYYLVAGIFLKIVRGVDRRIVQPVLSWLVPVFVFALLLAGSTAAGARKPGRYVVEMVPPEPVEVPAGALVVPYGKDGAGVDRVLVPYDEFRKLWRKAYPEEADATPPVAFAPAGAGLSGELEEKDSLLLTGHLNIDVYTDEHVSVPFGLERAVLERAEVAGRPARVRAVEEAPARSGKGKAARVAPRVIHWLYLQGKGRHRVDLRIRIDLTRQGGWRVANVRLPAAPATALALGVPGAGTEVALSGVPDRTLYKTEQAGETIHTTLAPGGRLSLKWRPRIGEGEVDRTLTVASDAIFDVREDRLALAWNARLEFRRGEREFFFVRLPPGYRVEKVAGTNVRGWDIEQDPQRTLRVRLLQRTEEKESFTVSLWCDSPVPGGAREVDVPALVIPDAIRHTGRVTLRRSALLDVRTLAAEGVRRVELPNAKELRTIQEEEGADPLGTVPYQAYNFVAVPFRIRAAVAVFEPEVRASVRTILRMAERERRVESRTELDVKDRALYVARLRLPPGLDVDRVAAPGSFEWGVSPDATNRVLTVRFAAGLTGRIPIVVQGRLGELGVVSEVSVPRFEVLNVKEQKGDLVVQADPAFDVRAVDLAGIETVLLRRVHTWLQEEQRSHARLALHYRSPAYSGRLVLVARKPDVNSYTVTNIRVTDRTIEETVLLHFMIRNAGIRQVGFLLPAYLADARIRVPLLRQKTVVPGGKQGWVRVTLDLQDEVMGELRVLVESDRLLRGSVQDVLLPVVRTGRMDRRYVSYESAGRDEVVVRERVELEPLSRQQKEWATVADLLRGGTTDCFVAAPSARNPRLSFETKQRQAVETAGASIGLARTVLFLDGNGAYRAHQSYNVDNQTEQFLALRLPEGASLWTAQVAGDFVKPVVPEGESGGEVRVPLVKTAPGDLDFNVDITYGGKLDGFGGIRRVAFPLMRTLNIDVERSQVELLVPRTHRWFSFEGTMRPVEEAGAFEAGLLNYQTRLAERLISTVKVGSVFEKARAFSNLKSLKGSMESYQVAYQDLPQNDALAVEMANAAKVLKETDEQLSRQVMQEEGEPARGNRWKFNEAYGGQDNTYTRNVVLDGNANWDESAVFTDGQVTVEAKFNKDWIRANDLENPALVDAQAPPEAQDRAGAVQRREVATLGRLRELGRGLNREFPGQAGQMQQMQQIAAQQMVNLDAGVNVPFDRRGPETADRLKIRKSQHGKSRRGQAELAQKYQQELEHEMAAQQRKNLVLQEENAMLRQEQKALQERSRSFRQMSGEVAAVGDTDGDWLAGNGEAPVGVMSGASIATPALSEGAATGLASLGVELPEHDMSRWERRRFSTPRGKVAVSAFGVPRPVLNGGKRLLIAAVMLLVVAALHALAGLRRRGGGIPRAVSTGMILAGTLCLLVGVLPVAALVVLAVGIVSKIRARRRARVAAAA